jgi:hypothetical protein
MIELVSGVDSALTRGSEYCPRTFRPPPEGHLHRHEAGGGPLREGSWTALMRQLGSFGSPVVNVASGARFRQPEDRQRGGFRRESHVLHTAAMCVEL